jgi:hypothetical protein
MSSKTYLRYEEAGSFGVIAAHDGNVVVDENGLLAFAAGLDDVLVWNVRSGELAARLRGEDSANPNITAARVRPATLRPALLGHDISVLVLGKLENEGVER